MARDDPGLTRTKNHDPRPFYDHISIIGKNVLDQETVVEEEKEGGQQGDKDDGIRNYVIPEVIEEYQVGGRHQHQVEEPHEEYPDPVLQARIADDPPVAIGQYNG